MAPPLGFKPDLILMLADDLGWNNVGWRNAELRTPALDEGRATGIDLQRMYAFKYCSPTRSSLMSGRLPLHVTQNNKNNDVDNPGGADLRMTLLPQRLKAAGYRTAAFLDVEDRPPEGAAIAAALGELVHSRSPYAYLFRPLHGCDACPTSLGAPAVAMRTSAVSLAIFPLHSGRR